MTAEVRSVVVKLSMENAQYIAAAVAAGDAQVTAMGKAKAATMSHGQAIDSLGSKAGKVGAGAALALGLMAKAAIDWESQWAGVTKTVDGTGAQLNELEGDLRDLATSLPATHEEIAGVAEAAGQLGVAREDIASFTKTMVDLGETTNLTAEGAATDIAQISNVMGTSSDDVDNLGAALVALGNDGASTEAQILGMAQRIAGAGAQIGLAESDILAIANAAASMGIEVEAGGSAISRVFTEMAKSTAQGGEGLEQFASVAGMSADEFTRAFEADPARAFAAFTSGLDRINQSGGDVFTTLDTLGLADVRVSQALLGMAASGDLLTDSLDLGSKAWAENTALTDEAAKRYDTTAAKTQVAWNKIKDAGIDAGGALLPVVADIAEGVGAVADAFGDLPSPVQSTITKLLALTAITGGAAWFGSKVIGGIASTKAALQALGVEATVTRSKLATVGTGVGLSVLALGYISDSNSIVDSMKRSRDAEDAHSKSVQDLADNLAASNVGKYAEDLGIDIQRLAEDLYANGESGEYASRVLKDLEESSHGVGAMFNSMGGTILPFYTANADKAYDANKDLKASIDGLEESAASAGVELAALPANVPEDSLWASFYAGADAAKELGYSSSLSAEEAKKQAEALAQVREAASETSSAFFDLTAATDDNKSSLAGWIKEMQDQADALANFTTNAIDAGENGVKAGLIDQLRELGPEGAKQMRWLANATEEEVARANRAWRRGQEAAENYSDSVTGVPALNMEIQDAEGRRRIMEIQRLVDRFGMTKAEAKAFIRDAATDKVKAIQRLVDQYGITKAEATALLRDMASGGIKAVAASLRALDGDRATTYIDTIRTTISRQVGPAYRSGGGQVFGEGTTTSDSIPAMLSNREYVIKTAAVDHYGVDFFHKANAMRLAGGGQATHTSRNGNSGGNPRDLEFTVGDSVAELRDALGELRADLKHAGRDWTSSMQRQAGQLVKLTRSYEKHSETLDKLEERSKAFSSEVAGSFNNDLFGNGLAGLDLQLQADTNDTKAMERALRKATRKGLDGGLFEALAASGDIGTATELAGLSRAEIAAYEKKFGRRTDASKSLGGFAADERFGAAIQRQERFLDKNERAIVRLIHTLEHLPGNVEEGTRRGNHERNQRIRSSVRAGVK